MVLSSYLKKIRLQDSMAFTLLIHFLISVGMYFTLQHFNVINAIPNNSNLLSWDASWYFSIMKSGYEFIPYQPCNMAFFPLFPVVWKVMNTSPLAMSAINFLIFYGSFFLLLRKQKLPMVFLLLLLTTPSFIFFGLPYSESVFFFFGVLLLQGYQDSSNLYKFLGFLGASLTRSVSLVFIPAIVISELFGSAEGKTMKQRIWSMAVSISGCLLGLFSSALLQFFQTGKWFYFLQIQQFWRRGWILPKLSLTTYDSGRVLGIDAVAFSLGLIAVLFCVIWAYAVIRKNFYDQNKVLIPESGIVFCALVLSATLVLDTFFTFNLGDSTNIWSLNRHLLCTPFALMFMIWLYRSAADKFSFEIIGISAVLILTICLTQLYKFDFLLLYYCLFFLSFIGIKIYPNSKNLLYILYPLGVILQIHFFQDFLNGKWIA